MNRIYVRISDDRLNNRNQVDQLKAQAPDGQMYSDIQSGSKKRPQLELMIQECQKNDVVWIWSLDRLTREGVTATLEYLKRIHTTGARVRSLREPWLDSDNPVWEILVACLAFGAKLERDRLIERTKAGIERARREGKSIGRPESSEGPSRTTLWRRRKV